MTNPSEPLADATAAGRQLVILSRDPPPRAGGLAPIGSRRELLKNLRGCNTGPESDEAEDLLYGPGVRLEMAPGQDPVTQMLVTIIEEEIGWQVLTRIVREFGWKLLDPISGRELTPPSAG